MFKLILDCGGHQNFISSSYFNDEGIARELGVFGLEKLKKAASLASEELFEGEEKPSFREHALAALHQERKLFEQACPFHQLPDELQENLKNLAQLIGLDAIEQKLIAFCCLMNTTPLLDECCDYLGSLGFNRLVRVLGILLDIPQKDLRQRLSPDGRLAHSGLLEANLHPSGRDNMSGYLDLSRDLPNALRHHRGSAVGLFQSAFRAAPASLLQSKDFVHLTIPLGIARPYLQQALATQKAGVNILVYGPPGTGKSQLTRLLAKELSAQLYEIACTDKHGDPIDRRGRLCALKSAMCVLSQQKTLLVLDEIEDLFSGSR